jgi:hypothetical protein
MNDLIWLSKAMWSVGLSNIPRQMISLNYGKCSGGFWLVLRGWFLQQVPTVWNKKSNM